MLHTKFRPATENPLTLAPIGPQRVGPLVLVLVVVLVLEGDFCVGVVLAPGPDRAPVPGARGRAPSSGECRHLRKFLTLMTKMRQAPPLLPRFFSLCPIRTGLLRIC